MDVICGGCGAKVGIVSKFGNGDELMSFVLMDEDASMWRFTYWKTEGFCAEIVTDDDGNIQNRTLTETEYKEIKEELFRKGEVEQ